MKKVVAIGLSVLVLVGSLSAQKTNTDSLKLASKLAADQLKLGQMQNQVEGKTNEKNDAAKQAQVSADENQKVANDLTADPQDQSLAKKASRKASDAKRDASRARKAAEKLSDLQQDIAKQKEKIGKVQSELAAKYPMQAAVAPAVSPTDSTRQ